MTQSPHCSVKLFAKTFGAPRHRSPQKHTHMRISHILALTFYIYSSPPGLVYLCLNRVMTPAIHSVALSQTVISRNCAVHIIAKRLERYFLMGVQRVPIYYIYNILLMPNQSLHIHIERDIAVITFI